MSQSLDCTLPQLGRTEKCAYYGDAYFPSMLNVTFDFRSICVWWWCPDIPSLQGNLDCWARLYRVFSFLDRCCHSCKEGWTRLGPKPWQVGPGKLAAPVRTDVYIILNLDGMSDSCLNTGIRISSVHPRFLPTSAVWNLVLTENFPFPTDIMRVAMTVKRAVTSCLSRS